MSAPLELPSAWTALLNPAAGRGRARAGLPRVADALAAIRDVAGLDVGIVVTASAADLAARAGDAFARGRGVVACGGDGTVAALAGLAAEAGGVLAVVPAGSGNDFARHVGIPRGDVTAAVDLLVTGTVTRVDLGRATTADGSSTWFTTVANTGFDAEANRWANTVHTISGTPLYVAAAARTLATYRPRRFRVTVDGDAHELEAWLVAVGNTRTYASGMAITPHASVHDGALEVCVVGAVSRAEFVTTFPKVFSGAHVDHPLVHTWRGRAVCVECSDDALDLWASGEHLGPLPATLTPVADALAVVVPRGATIA
jgi:diacylglycerol kinase (ATP)